MDFHIWNRCKKTAYFILFAVLLPVSGYIFYGAVDTLECAPVLQGILKGKMVPLFVLGASFLLCFLFVQAFHKAAPLIEGKSRAAVIVLLGSMVFLQIFMVLTVRTSLRYDHLKIFDTAVSLLDQGTIADTHFKHYFMKYPNNIPVCLFTYFWLKAASFLHIPREYWMEYMKLLNILFMNLGLWCAYRLLCRYRSRRTGICFLLLTFVDPLWYLLAQMYYTSTLSLAFSMGAVWFFERARRQGSILKKYADYARMGVLLAAGYKIRATVFITALAILIYAALQIAGEEDDGEEGRNPDIRLLARSAGSMAAALLGFMLIFGAYGKLEERYAGFDVDETGYPMIHWIMMSAQGEGQYNSADDAYTGSFSGKAERSAADMALLKERVRDLGADGLLTLFRNKMRIVFSDGTDDYYSLFRTMRSASPVQKYVNGSRSDYLALYLHAYHGMLTGLVLLALIHRAFRGRRDFLDIFALNLCGAYLFYLIWEADRAYSIPFMLILLMWAADGLSTAGEDFHLLDRSLSRPARRRVCGASAAAAAVLMLGVVFLVQRRGEPVREYSILQDQETGGDVVLQTEFSQTFRTARPFDHADIWVANWDGAANDSVYDIQIIDENGVVAAEGELVGADAPCINSYTVAFDRVIPEGEQIYRLQVKLRNPDCTTKTDFLYYQSGAWDMYPEGELYAPQEIPGADLAFAVYEEKR